MQNVRSKNLTRLDDKTHKEKSGSAYCPDEQCCLPLLLRHFELAFRTQFPETAS